MIPSQNIGADIQTVDQLKFEKVKIEALKQQYLMDELMLQLNTENLNIDDILSEGDFYFNNDQLIINLKETEKSANKEKVNKIRKIIERKINDDNMKYQLKIAKYSQDEMKQFIATFYEDNSNMNISKDTALILNTIQNRVDINTNEMSNETHLELVQKYGSMIQINIDPNFKVNSEYTEVKSPKDNWNSLGAGLAILNSTSNRCSTAGIAHKDTRLFLITAGHCINNIGEEFSQYTYDVGHAHLDARESDYDLGLIILDEIPDNFEIPGGRYASNGLYINGKSASEGGYDASLKGAERPAVGTKVCKTGTTTGFTCGTVKDAYYREWFGQIHIVVEVNEGEGTDTGNYLSAKGDSGGALFNPANNYLIGIMSQQETTSGAVYGGQPASRKGYFTPFIDSALKYGIYLYTDTTKRAIDQ